MASWIARSDLKHILVSTHRRMEALMSTMSHTVMISVWVWIVLNNPLTKIVFYLVIRYLVEIEDFKFWITVLNLDQSCQMVLVDLELFYHSFRNCSWKRKFYHLHRCTLQHDIHEKWPARACACPPTLSAKASFRLCCLEHRMVYPHKLNRINY